MQISSISHLLSILRIEKKKWNKIKIHFNFCIYISFRYVYIKLFEYYGNLTKKKSHTKKDKKILREELIVNLIFFFIYSSSICMHAVINVTDDYGRTMTKQWANSNLFYRSLNARLKIFFLLREKKISCICEI